MADAEVTELEQEWVDAAYAIAEQLLEARDGPTQAATQKDAQSIHRARRVKLEQLRQLSDDDRLRVRGRVDFASGSEATGMVAAAVRPALTASARQEHPDESAPGSPIESPAVAHQENEEAAGWSWFAPASSGDGLLHLTLAGSAARVDRVPASGGQGQPIATGHALSDSGATHWLLHREDGTVFALTTSREIRPASTAVVDAPGEPGSEQA